MVLLRRWSGKVRIKSTAESQRGARQISGKRLECSLILLGTKPLLQLCQPCNEQRQTECREYLNDRRENHYCRIESQNSRRITVSIGKAKPRKPRCYTQRQSSCDRLQTAHLLLLRRKVEYLRDGRRPACTAAYRKIPAHYGFVIELISFARGMHLRSRFAYSVSGI